MAKEKKIRDKAAEKVVKSRLSGTHLKYFKILGSDAGNNTVTVYVLRTVESSNYLFKVNCSKNTDGTYVMTGLTPVKNPDDFGEYRVYNPQTSASAEVLRPTGKEKNFKGYK